MILYTKMMKYTIFVQQFFTYLEQYWLFLLLHTGLLYFHGLVLILLLADLTKRVPIIDRRPSFCNFTLPICYAVFYAINLLCDSLCCVTCVPPVRHSTHTYEYAYSRMCSNTVNRGGFLLYCAAYLRYPGGYLRYADQTESRDLP